MVRLSKEKPSLRYVDQTSRPMGCNCNCSEHVPGTFASDTALCCEPGSFSGRPEVVWSFLLQSFFSGCWAYNLLIRAQSIAQECGCRSWNYVDHYIVSEPYPPVNKVGKGVGLAWGTGPLFCLVLLVFLQTLQHQLNSRAGHQVWLVETCHRLSGSIPGFPSQAVCCQAGKSRMGQEQREADRFRCFASSGLGGETVLWRHQQLL